MILIRSDSASLSEPLVDFLVKFRIEAFAMIKAMLLEQRDILSSEEMATTPDEQRLYDGYDQFWKINNTKSPLAFELYRIFLSASATSISAESLFSAMSHVYTDKRRSMSEKRLGQITLANALFRKPREFGGGSGGRKSILWPARNTPSDPPKSLAVELAWALLDEQEVDAIEIATKEDTAAMEAALDEED